MRIFKPSRRPGGRRLKGCICITIAGRTRRWDLKRQEWCMTTKRKINRSFLSPQGCAPVRYAHLHYALRGKKTKQQQPITKVPNLFQDLTNLKSEIQKEEEDDSNAECGTRSAECGTRTKRTKRTQRTGRMTRTIMRTFRIANGGEEGKKLPSRGAADPSSR